MNEIHPGVIVVIEPGKVLNAVEGVVRGAADFGQSRTPFTEHRDHFVLQAGAIAGDQKSKLPADAIASMLAGLDNTDVDGDSDPAQDGDF